MTRFWLIAILSVAHFAAMLWWITVASDRGDGLDQDCWGVPCLTRMEGLNEHWTRQNEVLRARVEMLERSDRG